jgi:hypothetical protein
MNKVGAETKRRARIVQASGYCQRQRLPSVSVRADLSSLPLQNGAAFG